MRGILGLIAILAGSAAQAALLGRAPLTTGGSDYQAYYDDVLDITWHANANLARSTYSSGTTPGFGTSFGVAGIRFGGQMTATTATAWIGAINAAQYLGRSDWRLPTVSEPGSDCNFAYSGTNCGYNVNVATGEMAHLFYTTLGNTAAVGGAGNPQPCSENVPNLCLGNSGPLLNLAPNVYWYAPAENPLGVWAFGFQSGNQNLYGVTGYRYAWPVLNGDPLAIVPLPAAIWLYGSALAVMGWMRRGALRRQS